MTHSSYLIRLPSSYYFRIRVPPTLQSVVGKKEIRYSLRCGCLSEAKPKARLLAGRIQQLFSRDTIMELSQGQIERELEAAMEIKKAVGKPYYHKIFHDRKEAITWLNDLT